MRRASTTLLAAGTLAAATALSGCGSTPDPTLSSAPAATPAPSPSAPSSTPTPTPAPTPLPSEPETVVDGLDAPWSIAVVGEGALLTERDSGRVLELTPDGELREAAEIDGVLHGGEGGLLGLAAAGDSVFVYATTRSGNRVERYDLRGEPGSLSLDDPVTIVEGLPFARTHNAGRIAIGPDGKLYVPVGDAGNRPAAQNPERRNGKILRLELDGSVPDDNPTPGSPVYSLGHRNVQGLAWDGEGRLWASEFGQNTWDELNLIEPGGNYGWPVVEGTGGEDDGFVDPIAQWPTDAASPSGIAIVGDVVLMANLRGEVLRSVSLSDPERQSEHYAGELGRLRDVTIGPDGAVWFLTNNTDGRGDPRRGDDRLLRVDPAALGGD
ncbi:PQQ-dependent sugar dehydrogenase [Microbacterium sp.]|uniref:PQQ-dependent sugar dehydrogenase n=1 Tax=Microbacterium sp. TaxID=51671 RepID=UPI0039E47B50